MNEFDLSLKTIRNGVSKGKFLSKISLFAAIVIVESFSSCKSKVDYYEAKTVYPALGKKTVFPPPGMVYVPAGAVPYKSNNGEERQVSLSPFFIDQTEVTNYQYRKFVNWVADSIAVTDILKDEKYFLKSKKTKSKKGSNNLTAAPSKAINWEKVSPHGRLPLWQNPDPSIQSKLQEAKLIVEINGKNTLNKEMVKYGYSFLHKAGPNNGKYIKESISAIPETDVWVKDFPNSQVDIMTENYYQTRAFDHYPVVGVTWEQAKAYTDWRSKTTASILARNNTLKSQHLRYNLPTEAQWQYAAAGDAESEAKMGIKNATVQSYTDKKTKKSKALVNYKQGEGKYTDDGATFTVPVKSYAPNTFGLYNMSGNVAEWTLDAFSPSALEFVHDRDPVLEYNADRSSPLAMKRKVIKGGSWKDNERSLDFKTRNYEIQDVPHSYIGFRCILPAPELITDQVRTRKLKELAPKKSKKSDSSDKKSKSKKSATKAA